MLYPMTFKPILKKIIWGGSAICPFKGITPGQEENIARIHLVTL